MCMTGRENGRERRLDERRKEKEGEDSLNEMERKRKIRREGKERQSEFLRHIQDDGTERRPR